MEILYGLIIIPVYLGFVLATIVIETIGEKIRQKKLNKCGIKDEDELRKYCGTKREECNYNCENCPRIKIAKENKLKWK